MNKWDKRFLKLAELISTWSKDPKHQVGCVLTDEYNRIVSTGYNGFPAGVDSIQESDRLALTIHAEENALIQATRPAVIAYIWPILPCSTCAAKLAQVGIQRIVSTEPASSKWRPDLTYVICDQLNIEIVTYDKSIL